MFVVMNADREGILNYINSLKIMAILYEMGCELSLYKQLSPEDVADSSLCKKSIDKIVINGLPMSIEIEEYVGNIQITCGELIANISELTPNNLKEIKKIILAIQRLSQLKHLQNTISCADAVIDDYLDREKLNQDVQKYEDKILNMFSELNSISTEASVSSNEAIVEN